MSHSDAPSRLRQIQAELLTAGPDRLLALGAELHRAGMPNGALAAFEQLAVLVPERVQAWHALAALRLELQQPKAALAACERALALDPNNSDTLFNIAVVLAALADHGSALAYYERVLAQQPEHYGALRNRPLVLNHLGQTDLARLAAETASAAYPDDPWLHFNRGELLLEARTAGLAIAAFSRALELAPDFHRARYALSLALAANGQVRAAYAEQRRALGAEPVLQHTYRSPLVLDEGLDEGDTRPERVAMIAAFEILRSCDWRGYGQSVKLYAELVEGLHDNPPLAQHEMPYLALGLPISEALRRQGARQAANRILRKTEGLRIERPVRQARTRLKLGYLSANFRPHPNAYLMGHLYARHDRQRFSVHAYSLGPIEDSPERASVMTEADCFRDLYHLPPDAAAQLIADDGIDILIDLSGFTRHACPEILALRPAPVQVSYTGFMGTQGAPYIDYALLDRATLTTCIRAYWDEKIAYLPHCSYHCELPEADTPLPRAAYGLPMAGTVLCALHHPRKLEPYSFRSWLRILDSLPGSVLWLLYETEEQISNLRREAKQHGLTPERLVFAPFVARKKHLARYRCADLFLDTFIYNGHTTTVDALSMGLPVVTLRGQSVVSRVSATMLEAQGMPELIADTEGEYQAIALRFVKDLAWRTEMQRRASDRVHSKLFQAEHRTREIETAYEMMWARHAAGLPPADFDVPDMDVPSAGRS